MKLGKTAPGLANQHDHYLATLWAEHFPKHSTHLASRSLCLTLCDIVNNEAQLKFPLAPPGRRLGYVLTRLHISEADFREIDVVTRNAKTSTQ
jgi:hypothetical protein